MSLSMYGNTSLLTTLAYEEELEETMNTMILLSSFIKNTKALKAKIIEDKQVEKMRAVLDKKMWTISDNITKSTKSISNLEQYFQKRKLSYKAPSNLEYEWIKMCTNIGNFEMAQLANPEYVNKVIDAIQGYRNNQIEIAVNQYAKRKINLNTFQGTISKQNDGIHYNTAILLYAQKSVHEQSLKAQGETREKYDQLQVETKNKVDRIKKALAKQKGYATIIMIRQLEKGAN